jgi:phenylacetate-CoA ligase
MIEYLWRGPLALIQVHIDPWFPPKWQRKFAERRVIREVQRAYKNVPYYQQKYDEAGVDIRSIRRLEDLKKLPFITKEEIHENFPERIVARGVNINKCHYSATTGSTGRSLPFIFSPATYAFYLATSMRVYTMIGFRPWHKSNYIKYNAVHYPGLGSSLSDRAHIPSLIPVEEQITRLRKRKPALIVGYASIVLEIARRVTPEELKDIRPKFISVNSEMSTQDERDFISHVFGCPVYDEYSTEEIFMIASQCRHHNYHLFIDNVWVEFLDQKGNDVAPGEVGEMVLTSMRSPAMPFIRYRIGDLGRPSGRTCPCGRGFPLIESFDGRCDDSFILPSGRFVSSLKVLNIFTTFIKKYLHLMEEFKVIQKERGLIVIQLVKGKEYREDHFQELIDKLHQVLGEPVTITVEMVDEIPMQGIKRKAIESWVSKDKNNCVYKESREGESAYLL